LVTVDDGAIYFGGCAGGSAVAGGGGRKWSVSANIVGNALYVASASSSKEYFLPTGNVRLVVAKKIGLKK